MFKFVRLKVMLFLTLCFLNSLGAYEYELAICTIFKDNASYLKEWIEFHLMMGAEHFYLFDNSSADHPEEVLQPYIDQGIVTLISWPNQNVHLWKNGVNWCDTTQKTAMLKGIELALGRAKWLALIDTDEFIVPVEESNLISFLNKYEKYPGITVYWDCYGTSDVWDLLPGQLLIEMLRMKCAPGHKMNKVPKAIIKPLQFSRFTWIPHEVSYIHNKRPYVATIDELRINHYVNRTLKFFFEVKIKAKETMENRKMTEAEINQYLEYGTDMEDFIMDKFIPELKIRMGFN